MKLTPEQLHVGIRQSGIPQRLKAWQAWPQPKGRERQTEKRRTIFIFSVYALICFVKEFI